MNRAKLGAKVAASVIAGWVFLSSWPSLLVYLKNGHPIAYWGNLLIAVFLLPAALVSFWWPRAAAIVCWLVTFVHFAEEWMEMSRLPHVTLVWVLRHDLVQQHTGWYFIMTATLMTWAGFFTVRSTEEISS